MDYAAILKRAIDKAPASKCQDRDKLEHDISTIIEQLQKPLSNDERIKLCVKRASLRKALVKLPRSM